MALTNKALITLTEGIRQMARWNGLLLGWSTGISKVMGQQWEPNNG